MIRLANRIMNKVADTETHDSVTAWTRVVDDLTNAIAACRNPIERALLRGDRRWALAQRDAAWLRANGVRA